MTDKQLIEKEELEKLVLTEKQITERVVHLYCDTLKEIARISKDDVMDMQTAKILHNVVYTLGTALGKSEKEMYDDLIFMGIRKQ